MVSTLRGPAHDRAIAVLRILIRVLEAMARGMHWALATPRRRVLTMTLLAVVGLMLSFMTHAHAADPVSCTTPGTGGVVNDASRDVDAMMSSWPQTMIDWMSPVFWGILSFTSIVGLSLEMPQTHGNVAGVSVVLAKFVALPFLVAAFYYNTPSMGPAIVNNILASSDSFTSGKVVTPKFSNLSSIDPGAAYQQFQCVADKIDDNNDGPYGFADFMKHPVRVLVDSAISFTSEWIVRLSGGLVEFELFAFKFEAMFIIGLGAALMAGLSAGILYSFPLRYLGALIGLGLKGVALAFLAGMDLLEASGAQSAFTAHSSVPPNVLQSISVGLLWLGIAMWFLPNWLQGLGAHSGVSSAGAFGAASAGASFGGSASGLFGKLFGGGGGGRGGPPPADGAETQPGNWDVSQDIELVPGESAGGGAAGGAAGAAEAATTAAEMLPK